MPCHRQFRVAAAIGLLGVVLPAPEAAAQQATISVTARVVPQPLSLRSVSTTAGAALVVGVEGCGRGTLTVDGRLATGAVVTVSRSEIEPGTACGRRDLLVGLAHRDGARIVEFEVRLTQGDALLAPSLSQVVVSAAATRTGTRDALLY